MNIDTINRIMKVLEKNKIIQDPLKALSISNQNNTLIVTFVSNKMRCLITNLKTEMNMEFTNRIEHEHNLNLLSKDEADLRKNLIKDLEELFETANDLLNA